MFHNAVLPGVIRQNSNPATWLESINHALQRWFNHIEFSVDRDANSLECPHGRMAALATDGGRYRFLHDMGQVGRVE